MRLHLTSSFVLIMLWAASVDGTAQTLAPDPSAEECQRWATALAAGGKQAMDALTHALTLCPAVAPSAFASAIRASRTVADTAYLGMLASGAGAVHDTAVFASALELGADRRATDRSRIMGLLITVAQLGAGQDVYGWTRPEMFTRVLPDEGICGLGVALSGLKIDNGLPVDAERQAARVIDEIRYRSGESRLLRNLARCARVAVDPTIPPQVDTRRIRMEYVCETRFRVQNHTPADLLLSYVLTDVTGTVVEEADVRAPAIGGWTSFTVDDLGMLRLSYDGQEIGSATASGKKCGGADR